MPDATLDDFRELVAVVFNPDENFTPPWQKPIMPRPHWGQEAAMLGFMIDGMWAEWKRLIAYLSQPEAVRFEIIKELQENTERFQTILRYMAEKGYDWTVSNLGEPYHTMIEAAVNQGK